MFGKRIAGHEEIFRVEKANIIMFCLCNIYILIFYIFQTTLLKVRIFKTYVNSSRKYIDLRIKNL